MDETTRTDLAWLAEDPAAAAAVRPALALIWSLEEPHRLGELVQPGERATVIGRGPRGRTDAPRATLVRQRPGGVTRTGPLAGRTISRDQLEVRRAGDGVHVRTLGRAPLRVDGREVTSAVAAVGAVVEVVRKVAFLVVERPRALAAHLEAPAFPFGAADPWGLVGESAAAWGLRHAVAFVARRDAHVLVLGPSGTGKELVARAVHAGSSRARGPWVARNAATLPPGVVDAELFGNAPAYPNPGMRERPGLVGQAHGGTLFLDELGELAEALQAHLLRVLDDGEYQRLGDARARRSDLRLIGATNRDRGDLKHDLAARLRLEVAVPPLDARREDIPLIAYHLLRRAADDDPDIAARIVGPDGFARVSPDLMLALVRHRYTGHVRELDALLWRALASSPGRFLDLTPAVRERLATPVRSAVALDRPTVEAALAAHDSVAGAAEALGLPSRYALYRLMKRLGVDR